MKFSFWVNPCLGVAHISKTEIGRPLKLAGMVLCVIFYPQNLTKLDKIGRILEKMCRGKRGPRVEASFRGTSDVPIL